MPEDLEAELSQFGQRTIVVTNPKKSYKVIQQLAECQSVVSVRGEGKNIGPYGEVSILQIGTWDGECYIFDLQMCPHFVFEGGIKFLMETRDVIKVMHDCRALSAALYCRFKIGFTCIFDTQCAYSVIQSQLNSTSVYDIPLVDLRHICVNYSCGFNSATNFMTKYSQDVDKIDWTRRPFSNHMVCLAAARVLCLVPEIFENMKL